MIERKTETFIYEDLGFPIKLINAPMKKVFGEWFLDINLSKIQKEILNILVNKPTTLTGDEIRFIRKYFEMTTVMFGSRFGATHATVLKWENNESRMNPATEFLIRLYVVDQLRTKDIEFRKFYHSMSLENLQKNKSEEKPIELNEKMFAVS